MVRTFKVAIVGKSQDAAASLALELGCEAWSETTFEVDYEGWKVYVFVTSPESQTPLPKVLDAVLLALNGSEHTDEFIEYIKKFDGVIHKIASVTGESDTAFATSLGIRTSTEQGVKAQLPTFLALDQELTELIQREFATFDRDSSGFIDLQELKEISSQLGQELSEEELQTALRELDTNQDGKISLEEFTEWWKSGRQGKNKIMRKLTQGVAKVKHLLDNAHAEIIRLTEVEEEAKYAYLTANITKGDLKTPQLGLSVAAFNSDNECRTKANVQNPAEDKSYYIQIGLKTANPEAFAEQFKQIFKELIKVASIINPEAAMIDAFVKLTTSFDEERTYINISSDFFETMVQGALRYRDFLCPKLPMHVKLDVVSGGDIGEGSHHILSSDLTISFEAKIAQVLQQLYLEFEETVQKFERRVEKELPFIVAIGLLKGVNLNLSTRSTTDLPVLTEFDQMFEHYRTLIRVHIMGLHGIPGIKSILSQLKDNVDASEIRVLVAADILTLTSRIYAKNISKFLLG